MVYPDRQRPPTGDGSSTNRGYSRRDILEAGGAGLVALAGCTGGADSDAEAPEAISAEGMPQFPRVSDPPAVVYKPSHRAEMVHLPAVEASEYTLAPMLAFSHRFWLVTGTEIEEVSPTEPGVHLMFTPWDAETGQVLPADAGAQMRVLRDGEMIDQRAPWPMISQTMGFHFGDNVPISENGTYTVEVDLNPITTRKTGAFRDRFEEGATASFEFEYDEELQRRMVEGVTYLDEEEWGEPGALEPMGHGDQGDDDHSGHDHGDDEADHDGHGDHNHGDDENDHSGHDHEDHQEPDGHRDHDGHDHHMPFSTLPPASEYPGRDLGDHESGDATFVVRYLEESRLAASRGYLVVSPRTPYNRVPLPDMALSVEGTHDTELEQTLDDEFGFHYGVELDLEPGDDLELVVESPPQVSRHAGYETAFVEMPPMEIETK